MIIQNFESKVEKMLLASMLENVFEMKVRVSGYDRMENHANIINAIHLLLLFVCYNFRMQLTMG